MSALAYIARVRASSVRLIRLLRKQITPVSRQCHDYKKEIMLKDLKDSGKYDEIMKHHKPWVSYGFSEESEALDRHIMHTAFFFAVTLILVTGGFAMAYSPDTDLRHWAQREAFLQLRYREENGLPLIDPNFIDPARINLPSDEELGDTEIII